MAWYALYKWFITFRKKTYTNYIRCYKRYLYDEWFNNLSEEEQKTELKRQQRIKEKRKHDGEVAISRLRALYNMMNNVTHGRMGEYMEIARDMNRISLHPSKYW